MGWVGLGHTKWAHGNSASSRSPLQIVRRICTKVQKWSLAVRGDQLLHLLHNAKMLRVHMLSFHSMLPKTVAQSFSGGVAIYVVYFRFCGWRQTSHSGLERHVATVAATSLQRRARTSAPAAGCMLRPVLSDGGCRDGFPGLFTDTSEHIRFLLFSFFLFSTLF